MSHSAVHRPTRQEGKKRIVRYYVIQKAIQQGYKKCRIKTVNAKHLDDLVRSVVFNQLETGSTDALCRSDHATRDYWIRKVVHRVLLGPVRLTVELEVAQLETLKDREWSTAAGDEDSPPYTPDACLYRPDVRHVRGRVVLELAIQLKRLDGKRLILAPDGRDLTTPAQALSKPHLVEAVGRAYAWRQLLIEYGLGIAELPKRLGVADPRNHELLPLTHLSPAIVKRVLTGQLTQHATWNICWPPHPILSGADSLSTLDSIGSRPWPWPKPADLTGLPPENPLPKWAIETLGQIGPCGGQIAGVFSIRDDRKSL